jgi:hypothetical protein
VISFIFPHRTDYDYVLCYFVGYTPFPCLFPPDAVGFNLSWLDRIALRAFFFVWFCFSSTSTPPFSMLAYCLLGALEFTVSGWLALVATTTDCCVCFFLCCTYGVTSSMRASDGGRSVGGKATWHDHAMDVFLDCSSSSLCGLICANMPARPGRGGRERAVAVVTLGCMIWSQRDGLALELTRPTGEGKKDAGMYMANQIAIQVKLTPPSAAFQGACTVVISRWGVGPTRREDRGAEFMRIDGTAFTALGLGTNGFYWR